MNILAIGAHFDDLELGCGGALARHVDSGDLVIGYVATNSAFNNRNGMNVRLTEIAQQEAEKASSIIGYKLIYGEIDTFDLEFNDEITSKLIKIIEENKIDMIYTHWDGDVHHDHRNLSFATMHVARHINKILMYRSNWYDGIKVFKKELYVDISKTWQKKKNAILAYKSEYDRVGDAWIKYFENEAVNNGLKCNVSYAESFQVVKWLL